MKLVTKLIIQSCLIVTNLSVVSFKNESNVNVNKYHNLFVIGDSLSDTGAFVQYAGSTQWNTNNLQNCDSNLWTPSGWGVLPTSPPKKMWVPAKFHHPFYQNSFSNGPVAIQVVANKLNLKNFTTASYEENNFDNFGYNYATGGASILDASDSLIHEFNDYLKGIIVTDKYNLENQIKMLKNHHHKIDKNDLLIINIGSNDVIKAIEAATLEKNTMINNLISKRLKKAAEFLYEKVRELIDYGFNRVGVCNLGYVDELPRYRASEKNTIASYMDSYFGTEFALNFRETLLNLKYTNKIRLINIRSFFNKYLVSSKMKRQIIENSAVDINWISNFLNDEYIPYYVNGANEHNVDSYAFFDDIHPSKNFHRYIGEQIYQVINKEWEIV